MNNIPTFRYNAVFSKKGDMIFISHLDLMTLFRRAMKRAELPVVITGGFTPRVKISIPKALKLGEESDREEMSFWLNEEMGPGEVMALINGQLPEGIKVLEIRRQG
jgi:radical SAM-linked protein